MTANWMNKWIAAGVLAVATIPAVGFARSHRPVQAAPPSLMATGPETPVVTTSVLPDAKPAALETSHAKKLHSKLHARKASHRGLSAGKHKSRKLSHKHGKHTSLHSTSRTATVLQ